MSRNTTTTTDQRAHMSRLTFTTPPEVLERVEAKRAELEKQTGLRVSTSGLVTSLIRAGLDATRT